MVLGAGLAALGVVAMTYSLRRRQVVGTVLGAVIGVAGIITAVVSMASH